MEVKTQPPPFDDLIVEEKTFVEEDPFMTGAKDDQSKAELPTFLESSGITLLCNIDKTRIGRRLRTFGYITDVVEVKDKIRHLAFVTVGWGDTMKKLIVFNNVFLRYREDLLKGNGLFVCGVVTKDREDVCIKVESISCNNEYNNSPFFPETEDEVDDEHGLIEYTYIRDELNDMFAKYGLPQNASRLYGELDDVSMMIQRATNKPSDDVQEELWNIIYNFILEYTKVDYYKYIKSDQWKQRANHVKEHFGNRCQLCNISRDERILHAHHRTYERLGNELPEDLTVLCEDCHSLFHEHKKLVASA